MKEQGAGQRAAIRAAKLAKEMGMNVKIIRLTDGKDPAECILKNPDNFRKEVDNPMTLEEFTIRDLAERCSSEEEFLEELYKLTATNR